MFSGTIKNVDSSLEKPEEKGRKPMAKEWTTNANITLAEIRTGEPGKEYQYQLGVANDGIKAIQKALHMYGYNLNLATGQTADGIYGAYTQANVRGFQTANGIEPATGIMDAETLAKLEAWSGTLYETPTATPALKAVEYGLDILHIGDSGAAVYSVQSLLTRHGFTCQTTGSYTSTVVSLVKQFQKKNSLDETGNVDQVTLAVLEDLTSATAWLNGSTVNLTAGKLAKAGFRGIVLKPEVVADINKGLNKYGITTGEKVLHFLAQAMEETKKGEEVIEDLYKPGVGYENATYNPYCGAGVLQMTWADAYKKFKDHVNNASNGYSQDNKIYPGDDNGKYATQHVALHYPGTSSAWFWNSYKMLNEDTTVDWKNWTARQISDKLTTSIKGNVGQADLNQRYNFYVQMQAALPFK